MANFSKSTAELRAEISGSSAQARIFLQNLFDEGTFLELGTYIKSGEGIFEGVVTGCGSIEGRPVYIFVQDNDNGRAAFTVAHGKKIVNLYDAAMKAGAPVIGVFSGAGAKLEEGISCLSAYGTVMAKVTEAKGIIPQIAVVTGVCGGASAILSEMFDILLCSDKAERYLSPNGAKLGTPDIEVESTLLETKLRELISLLPSNCEEGTVCGIDCEEINTPVYDLEALVSDDSDAHELINALSDDNSALFLSEKASAEALTALMTFNGRVVGAVASQPKENGGALTASSAKKIASFVNFCGGFNIPVITLVNTVGFKGKEGDYLSALSDLAFVYSSCPSPTVTAIVGKAYGSAFTLLGSKALGADVVFAIDRAEISVVNPDTAVEFLCDKELKEASDPKAARASLKEEWLNTSASALAAARAGEVDDIVSSDELKQRIASALEFLA